jgi:hypothetical protein
MEGETVVSVSMLTTIDNPYDPFTQYDEWEAYDEALGHYSCALLARVAKTSDELSELDEAIAIDTAIDEIVRFNVSGVHIKVTKE